MQTIVYHSKARKTMCGMGTFCLIGMISFQLTMQNSEMIKTVDATWFDNGLKLSIIGTPGAANYRLSLQSRKGDIWYGDILFDRYDQLSK